MRHPIFAIEVHATSATSFAVASDVCTLHGATQNSFPRIACHPLRTAAMSVLILAGCLPWGVLLTYFNGEHSNVTMSELYV